MKTRSIYILFLMCVTSVMMVAQENKNTLPDLQVANMEFFDPTRKDKSKENYVFSTTWRLEAGYAQLDQRQDTSSLFMHGLRIGATVDFNLPYRFSIQTGALATFTYGQNNQHYPLISAENAQINILQHNILQLQLTVPVRAYYNIKLWKQLRLLFFAGPQLQFGLTNYDIINNKTSADVTAWLEQNNVLTTNHDRYITRELHRTNIQFGIVGGLEWDRYRLQAGYDFGLNNILRTPILPNQKMHEWGWFCTFSYRL